jgi:hypothetical protein
MQDHPAHKAPSPRPEGVPCKTIPHTKLPALVPRASHARPFRRAVLLLSEITGQARNRVYCAGEVLTAIERPLQAGLPQPRGLLFKDLDAPKCFTSAKI